MSVAALEISSLSPLAPSPLRRMPLARWASRLKGGQVELRGHLRAPFDAWAPGPVAIRFDFVGGERPEVLRASVNGVAVDPDDALFDLVDLLHDPSVRAAARPDGDLLIRLALGVEIVIPEHTELRLSGATAGPPHAPLLTDALALSFGGEGLRLSHGVRWVARLAELRLAEARLHPDGAVSLDARGSNRASDLALRLPLGRAAASLTELVRRSPRIRAFLRHS